MAKGHLYRFPCMRSRPIELFVGTELECSSARAWRELRSLVQSAVRGEDDFSWTEGWIRSGERYRPRGQLPRCPLRVGHKAIQLRFNLWWALVPQEARPQLLHVYVQAGLTRARFPV